ncbi:MAG: hypothetical protein ACR2G0_11615 [Chthoniobacterales bacterium]
MKQQDITRERGTALIVVLSVIATLTVTAAVSMQYTTNIRHMVQRSEALQSAITIGDGVVEHSYSYWREICRGNTDANLTTTSFQGIPLPTQSQFPNVINFAAQRALADPSQADLPTVSNFQIIAVDPQMRPTADGAPLVPAIGQSPITATYAYLAQADISMPVLGGNVTAKVRRVLQKEQLSPWNWAIFYVDPLEIHPGALMNVTGWVHTNSNLFTGHDLLTFQSKVTYGTDWVIGFRPGDSRAPGGSSPEAPTTPHYPANLPPAYDVAHQPFGLDATRIFTATDGNPNNDSYHELIEPPTPGYEDPLAGKRYYDQAGVKVLIDGSNNITIKDQNGNNLNASSPGIGGVIYSTFSAAITTNQSIQDNREGASVRLATLDMGAVTTKIRDGTLAPFNNIIYISDTSASQTGGSPKRGIRLKNGAIMPDTGLTVASQNPVYIQGDYNTGGSNPPSNSGDYSKPQITGYSRKPCAVVADAVNILSNAWNDANAASGLSSRVASNTTVNTAIVSGIVPSSSNDYSGGAENFPRFLESWSGKSLTYYGSMVELYPSRQSIGRWGSGNVYNPPNRQWFFDQNLQIYTPPGSLPVFSYTKGRWFLAQ